MSILNEVKLELGSGEVVMDAEVAKISIVGAGIAGHLLLQLPCLKPGRGRY